MAKIERAEAVADDDALDGLIRASDAVMVARGDLGVEIGDAELVGIQKIILHARRNNKVVITATQMMESMIHSPMPTRAEVSDVANAVLDYTDAVMLSAEAPPAVPGGSGESHGRVCQGAEAPDQPEIQPPPRPDFRPLRRGIALASMYGQPLPGDQGDHLPDRKRLHPLIMSRIRSSVPIYAYSARGRLAWRCSAAWKPSLRPGGAAGRGQPAAVDELLKRGVVTKGDWVILTRATATPPGRHQHHEGAASATCWYKRTSRRITPVALSALRIVAPLAQQRCAQANLEKSGWRRCEALSASIASGERSRY